MLSCQCAAAGPCRRPSGASRPLRNCSPWTSSSLLYWLICRLSLSSLSSSLFCLFIDIIIVVIVYHYHLYHHHSGFSRQKYLRLVSASFLLVCLLLLLRADLLPGSVGSAGVVIVRPGPLPPGSSVVMVALASERHFGRLILKF